MFLDEWLHERIISGACDLIDVDRKGPHLDRDTFEKAIAMFHDLQVYTTYFEPRMLQQSQSYICEWSESASKEKSVAGYVHAAQALMDKEMERVQTFKLDATTRRELLTLLENNLVTRKVDELSESRGRFTQFALVLTLNSKSRRTR